MKSSKCRVTTSLTSLHVRLEPMNGSHGLGTFLAPTSSGSPNGKTRQTRQLPADKLEVVRNHAPATSSAGDSGSGSLGSPRAAMGKASLGKKEHCPTASINIVGHWTLARRAFLPTISFFFAPANIAQTLRSTQEMTSRNYMQHTRCC